MAQLIRSGQSTFDAAHYLASPLRYDQVLARAREAGEQVECLCASTPRPMVVRQVNGRHFLAVWPLDGAQHAASCVFYRDEAAMARRRDRLARTGLSDCVEDAALGDALATPPAPVQGPSGGTAETSGAGLLRDASLLAEASQDEPFDPVLLPLLLGELWTLSGLQRWMPGWSRDWARIRRSVRAAARRLSVHRLPVDQLLFVAPGQVQSGASGEWQRLTEDMRQSRRRHLVLAQVRAAGSTPFGWRLDLAGIPQPIFVPAKSREALQADCASLSQAQSTVGNAAEDGFGGWVALLDVRVSVAGNASAVDGHLQPLSHTFFLAEGPEDARLADELAGAGRAFEKRLPAACLANDRPHPADMVLRDSGESGVALLLLRRGAAVPRAEVAEFALERLSQGEGVWVWDVGQDLRPALPGPMGKGDEG